MSISVEDKRAVAALYSGVVTHMCHQDKLAWSYVPIMMATQVSLLSASYLMRHTVVVYPIMASLLAFMLIELGLYDKLCKDRDVNMKVLDAITNEVLPDEMKKILEPNMFGSYVS